MTHKEQAEALVREHYNIHYGKSVWSGTKPELKRLFGDIPSIKSAILTVEKQLEVLDDIRGITSEKEMELTQILNELKNML